MFSFRHRIFIFSLSVGILFFCKNINAQESLWGGYRTDMPLPGTNNFVDGAKKFFLLKTGLLVEATVTSGENFVKLKTQYGTMQVPKENIEFAGETREDVYHYKKSLVAPNSCTQELNFAEWCLNNGFHNEALTEFQAALLTAQNENLKNYIQQRIEQVQNGVAVKDADNVTDSTDDTTDSFDRWANGVPKSVYDTFAKKVQPILVQRCASAACHGSNSPQKFKIAVPRQPGGKTTRNNLRATVQFINPDNPGASPVLSALVAQHAGKRALFSVESEQYNNVIDWFQLTAKELPPECQNEMIAQNTVNQNTVKPAVPQPAVQTAAVKSDILPKQFQESLEAMTKTGLKIQTAAAVPNLAVNTPVPKLQQPARAEPKTAANVSASNIPTNNSIDENKPETGTDPFDPLRFNSKYHSKIIEAKLKKQVSDTVIR